MILEHYQKRSTAEYGTAESTVLLAGGHYGHIV